MRRSTPTSSTARVDHRLSEADEHLRPVQLRQVLPQRSDGVRRRRRRGARVSLGGVSDVKNQSLAIGVDHTLSSTLLADFRFGWFQYDVNVLPFDFGTTPAKDAGIPGLNLDTTFTSGLPAFFINGDRGVQRGLGPRREPLQLPARREREAVAGGRQRDEDLRATTASSSASTCAAPTTCGCRPATTASGELTFNSDRTSLNGSGGIGLATFLLGDVTHFARYVSTNTDARERQWRHFYYAQDTWRPRRRSPLNYGLRLDVINPQTVNEAGNGGWLDLSTGEILIGGVGDVDLAGNVEEPAELGAARRRDLPVERQDGHPRRIRPHVRHRRVRLAVRTQRDAEPAGALDAADERAIQLRSGVHARPGPAGRRPSSRRPPAISRCPTACSRARCRPSSGRLRWTRTTSPCSGSCRTSMSVEVGYVGNYGAHQFVGDGPGVKVNEPDTRGVPGRAA